MLNKYKNQIDECRIFYALYCSIFHQPIRFYFIRSTISQNVEWKNHIQSMQVLGLRVCVFQFCSPFPILYAILHIFPIIIIFFTIIVMRSDIYINRHNQPPIISINPFSPSLRTSAAYLKLSLLLCFWSSPFL